MASGYGSEGRISPTEADNAASESLELVYVVGHHRSGATALGAVLASDPRIFFAGELYRFPVPIWSSEDPRRACSCGQPVLQCPFWSVIRREAERGGLSDRLRAGQVRYERWSALPRTLLARWTGSESLDAYARTMGDFLRLLKAHSHSPIIVEFGPSALRGVVYRSARAHGVNVRFLHLVRDGRGFLASELRTGHDPEAPNDWIRNPLLVVGRWVGMNLAALLLCARDPSRYRRVRFEELLLEPSRTLLEIGRFLGIDLSRTAERVEARRPIPMRHIAAGNRTRLQGEIVLDQEIVAPARLSRPTRVMYWAVAGWLAGFFGYRLDLSRRTRAARRTDSPDPEGTPGSANPVTPSRPSGR